MTQNVRGRKRLFRVLEKGTQACNVLRFRLVICGVSRKESQNLRQRVVQSHAPYLSAWSWAPGNFPRTMSHSWDAYRASLRVGASSWRPFETPSRKVDNSGP